MPMYYGYRYEYFYYILHTLHSIHAPLEVGFAPLQSFPHFNMYSEPPDADGGSSPGRSGDFLAPEVDTKVDLEEAMQLNMH